MARADASEPANTRLRQPRDAGHADGETLGMLARTHTLGEASLVMGDHAAAQGWYRQAAGRGEGRLGDLVSTRRNARLILAHRPSVQLRGIRPGHRALLPCGLVRRV